MARGTIETIEKKIAPSTGKDYWRIKIAGDGWYSAWDSKLVTGIAVGDEVEFSFTTQGDFRNIKTLAKAGPVPQQPISQPSARPPYTPEEPDKQLSIVRQSCLRRAVELIIEEGLSVSLMEKADKAIGVAAYFTGWVMGAHEKPAPQEPEEQTDEHTEEHPPVEAYGDDIPF